jgi:hypothetical protein
MKKSSVITTLSIILLVTGCGQTSPPIKPQPEHRAKVNQQIKVDPQRAALAKVTAMQVKGVEDSAAMVVDQDIAAAIKVSGFNRLRIKSIRDQASQRIKSSNRGFKVYLTSDKKLFVQLRQLEKDTRGTPMVIKTKINKIISDM